MDAGQSLFVESHLGPFIGRGKGSNLATVRRKVALQRRVVVH